MHRDRIETYELVYSVWVKKSRFSAFASGIR